MAVSLRYEVENRPASRSVPAMRLSTSLPLVVALAFGTSCSTPGKPSGNGQAEPGEPSTSQAPAENGSPERFVIKDPQGRVRVDGRVARGRMDGLWTYYDSKGGRLAVVTYRDNQRHGPARLYFVAADGPAAGRSRMTGSYVEGSADGMTLSHWPSGAKKLEREFDRGILQGARGWTEKGTRLEDGAAMGEAIAESRVEDSLLAELENFVQLQLRKQGATSQDRVPDILPETPGITPLPLGYSGTPAPLPN